MDKSNVSNDIMQALQKEAEQMSKKLTEVRKKLNDAVCKNYNF